MQVASAEPWLCRLLSLWRVLSLRRLLSLRRALLLLLRRAPTYIYLLTLLLTLFADVCSQPALQLGATCPSMLQDYSLLPYCPAEHLHAFSVAAFGREDHNSKASLTFVAAGWSWGVYKRRCPNCALSTRREGGTQLWGQNMDASTIK